MLGDEISEPLWERLSTYVEGEKCRGCGRPYQRNSLHVQPIDDRCVFVRCLHCTGERVLPKTPLHFEELRLRWLRHVATSRLAHETKLALMVVGACADDKLVLDIDDIAWDELSVSADERDAAIDDWLATGLVARIDQGQLVLTDDFP